MLRQILISIVIMFTIMSCASSTRYPGRHSDENTKTEGGLRYGENSGVNGKDSVFESRVGVASYYSDKYEGRKTTSGEIFSQDKLTAAHPTYSMGTIVRVKNLLNRKTVVVRINDRMTNLNGRIIDLSKKAAGELDMIKSGIAKVQVDVLKWGDAK